MMNLIFVDDRLNNDLDSLLICIVKWPTLSLQKSTFITFKTCIKGHLFSIEKDKESFIWVVV